MRDTLEILCTLFYLTLLLTQTLLFLQNTLFQFKADGIFITRVNIRMSFHIIQATYSIY